MTLELTPYQVRVLTRVNLECLESRLSGVKLVCERKMFMNAKVAVDSANQEPYQLSRQTIKIESFSFIARSKAVILG